MSHSRYQSPDASWKYISYTYDALGRVTTQTGADGTSISHDFTTAWQDLVTNQSGNQTRYHYDAFNRLIKVEELDGSHQLYATTTYAYDVLGNLVQVVDDDSNTTTMTYDWLSRKTAMTDPDMGSWTYTYDNNGNLVTQADAKSQTVTMAYDALSRLTSKSYSSANMTDVSYSYDEGVNGNGQRTGMADASGNTTYEYDARGRIIEEKRTLWGEEYTTRFGYDGADRNTWILYPSGENVTQGFNRRGLPYSLSGNAAGNIVNSTLYNGLGAITEINLGNGLSNTYEYWGIDEPGGYYGRLYGISVPDLMDVRHTWDAGGNLASRYDALIDETETFSYDFLDRLTGVSGNYTQSYSYSEIGNIMSMNSNNYSYDSSQPHAVDAVGATSYLYDANGNMYQRGAQTITWDAENRPVTVSENSTVIAEFVYDGDGNRVKKIEGGQTILYINIYYEVNVTTGNATSHYYLGNRLVAMKENTALRYVHQDHLTGTSLMTDTSGDQIQTTMKYYPYGLTRSGAVPTDKKFTGQRLDGTGLYYYGARYYDATMGRFISPDTIIPHPFNPQSLNRYSYCLNNPLKYIDPSGQKVYIPGIGDVENVTMDSWIWLMHMTPEARGEVMETVIAYNEFSKIYSAEAAILENSDISYNVHSDTERAQDIHITTSQKIHSAFTMLAPLGYGEVDFSINAEWYRGSVKITVSATTQVIAPETSFGFGSAEVNGKEGRIVMKTLDTPYIITPHTDFRMGSISLTNGFPESKIVVDLNVNAWSNSTNLKNPSYHIILNSWSVLLWEGK